MNPDHHPTTDTLPTSRRTVIINTGLAAAAIAGLSSCTNSATAPDSQPAATSGSASGGSSGAGGPVSVKTTEIPIGNGKIFPRRPDGDHSAQEGPIQGIQRNLYAYGMSGRQHHHDDQLPLPWQQILDRRRLCGESACPTAAASEDDQGQGRHAYRHLKPAPLGVMHSSRRLLPRELVRDVVEVVTTGARSLPLTDPAADALNCR
jgi:hypothetical protein